MRKMWGVWMERFQNTPWSTRIGGLMEHDVFLIIPLILKCIHRIMHRFPTGCRPFSPGVPRADSHNANGVKLPCFEEGKIPIFRIGSLLFLIRMIAFSFLYAKFCCGRISLHFGPSGLRRISDWSGKEGPWREKDGAAWKAGLNFTHALYFRMTPAPPGQEEVHGWSK